MDRFDLIIVGTGSGNMIPSPQLDDWRIGLIEKGVFGGTCLNRGCIPSKMFVYAADVAEQISHAGAYGLDAELRGSDWPGIVKRVFGRIDPIAAGGEEYRSNGCPNVTVLRGEGRFVAPMVLEVDGREVSAPKILLGAGARPHLPDAPGLPDTPFHTSDTIMRIPALPRSLLVLGGGFIGVELSHVFAALGVEVTLVTRGPRILSREDVEISAAATAAYAKRVELVPSAQIERVSHDGAGFTVQVNAGGPRTLRADLLLVATGRTPNSDVLAVEACGIDTHIDGRVVVDDAMATNVPGVWAFGDLTNPYQLKHIANAEAKIAFHNLADPAEPTRMDYSIVPHAVFGNPQVASVGLTEEAVEAAGLPYVKAVKPYAHTAYGWAMEDTTSFVKLIAHAETRRLLGAHIIGPQASTLIQQLIQGMRFGQTVDEMAHQQIWIHPALTEVVENALLEL
ncbi:MAG: mycothione reductase [Acidimicrobiales bacterium]